MYQLFYLVQKNTGLMILFSTTGVHVMKQVTSLYYKLSTGGSHRNQILSLVNPLVTNKAMGNRLAGIWKANIPNCYSYKILSGMYLKNTFSMRTVQHFVFHMPTSPSSTCVLKYLNNSPMEVLVCIYIFRVSRGFSSLLRPPFPPPPQLLF